VISSSDVRMVPVVGTLKGPPPTLDMDISERSREPIIRWDFHECLLSLSRIIIGEGYRDVASW
jgi:hypothetical protein